MGSKVAILVESMAELEIVPRPEVTAAISDDPHNLSDVSSEDKEEEEEFTAIELVRAVPVPNLVPAVHVRTSISPTSIGTHLRHQWNSIWYRTHLPVLICDKGPNRYNIRYYNPGYQWYQYRSYRS